jgi:hypothetical protein
VIAEQVALPGIDPMDVPTEQWSADGRGWAQFSADGLMRYRLARSLTATRLMIKDGIVQCFSRITFLMLNPSTADAFKLDPTIKRCLEWTGLWGYDVLEVVNLFALRSSKPKHLLRWPTGQRGDNGVNDRAIQSGCTSARVIIAYGNGGRLDGRGRAVSSLLRLLGVELECLGYTGAGFPKHPLARGKHRIPRDVRPTTFDLHQQLEVA